TVASGRPIDQARRRVRSDHTKIVAPGGEIPGRLIPPDDPDALAGALRNWLADGELRDRWRAHARARRDTLTGWDETARRMAQVLAGL
ncbi:hypothetical protein AB0C31_49450, partial [Actinoplanes philippinensis]